MTTASLFQKNEHLTCSICFEVYRFPRSLPCLHTFCEASLQSYITTAGKKGELKEKKFVCPICRDLVAPPSNAEPPSRWAKLFPYNYALLSVLEGQATETTGRGDQLCDLCAMDKMGNTAVVFCEICKKYLCKKCSTYHRRSKASKNHKLTELGKEYACETRAGTVSISCAIHPDEEIKFFCKDDHILCCSKCGIFKHRKCQDIVAIEDITSSEESMTTLGNSMDRLKCINKFVTNLMNVTKTNIDYLANGTREILEEVRSIRQTIISRLKDLEQDITRQCQELCNLKSQVLNDNLNACKRHVSDVNSVINSIQSVIQYGSITERFIAGRRIVEDIQKYEETANAEHRKAVSVELDVEVDPALKRLLEHEGPLVKVKVKDSALSIPILEKSQNQDVTDCQEASGKINQRRSSKLPTDHPVIHHGTVDVKRHSRDPYYTGALCLADGGIVLVDYNTSRIILLDSSYSFRNQIHCDGDPWKVSLNDRQELIVSFYNKKYLQFVTIENNKLVLQEQLATSHVYNTVCPINLNQYVCGSHLSKHFSIVTTDGSEIKQRSCDSAGRKFMSFQHLCLSRDGQCLYQPCFNEDALYCFSLEGTLYFKYTHPQLKRPEGVDFDKEGNIFVCGCISNNIHQLTPDGNLIKIIQEENLRRPLNICFLCNGKDFFVTSSQDDKLHLFSLET